MLRQKKFYEEKRVEVFHIEEEDEIVTVIVYNDKMDLLYIRFDDKRQDVINRRISEEIVLDIGDNDRIVGIEILDASRHILLEKLLPVKYEVQKEKSIHG